MEELKEEKNICMGIFFFPLSGELADNRYPTLEGSSIAKVKRYTLIRGNLSPAQRAPHSKSKFPIYSSRHYAMTHENWEMRVKIQYLGQTGKKILSTNKYVRRMYMGERIGPDLK
ncbi:BA75_02537T0 [Komagataella pastoris]|uniref:BA75_02537T0 n=1 Tax=Komagataella pastoris TaxID=4922 RepID=A0A1B2JC07_PICPA|nr:BA75_02537T0 [Komagataella pastoris]